MRYLVGLSDRAMNMAQPVEQGERSINKMFKGRGMGRERMRWGKRRKKKRGLLEGMKEECMRGEEEEEGYVRSGKRRKGKGW